MKQTKGLSDLDFSFPRDQPDAYRKPISQVRSKKAVSHSHFPGAPGGEGERPFQTPVALRLRVIQMTHPHTQPCA